MENPIKMDDLGGKPTFSETSICVPSFAIEKGSQVVDCLIALNPMRWTQDCMAELEAFAIKGLQVSRQRKITCHTNEQ